MFKFTTWGSSDPQDGNFGFPEVCREGRRLKVITASSSGSQTPISRSPAQRCPPGLRPGPAAREIRQPGKGRSHHSRGPRGDRANAAPHTGFLRAKPSCGPQGGGHGHVSAEGRGWKWEKSRCRGENGSGEDRWDDGAHGPSEERSPAALSSLRDSPHPPAAHLAPLARGENSHCAGEAEVATQRCRRPAVGRLPASKMAAAAAFSGALRRAGWRLLQLRCLPGEGAAEPGTGEGSGGGGTDLVWVRGGRSLGPAREQGELKGIMARAGAPALKWSLGWLLTTFSTCEEQEHQGRACHSHFTELTEPERGL